MSLSLSDLLILASGIGIGGTVIVLILSNLESVIKLWSWCARIVYKFRRNRHKNIVAIEIAEHINGALLRLRKEVPTVFNQSFRIQWISNASEFSEIKDGEVILYIQENPDQNRVLVNTTMLYLQQGVLNKSRPFIERRLLNAIDVTLAQRILADRPYAYEHLQKTYVDPLLNNDTSVELYQLSEKLEEFGVLTRIVLLEYSGLSNRLRGKQSTSRIREETVNFAQFVGRVVDRQTIYVPLRFYGRLFSTTVALVADPVTAQVAGIPLYQRKFRRDIENGVSVVHLLARGTSNVQLARFIAKWAVDKKLVSRILPSYYSEPTSTGERVSAACITCYSGMTGEIPELSPVDEVYSVLAEIVPEILLGKVEVVAVEREVGIRTKIMVRSSSNDNPVGYFVGNNGANVDRLKTLLSTEEEIDFIRWSLIPEELITQSLYPLRDSEITRIELDSDNASANVYVKSRDLIGLTIGARGINIRLAQQVTGYKIDVLYESELNTPEDEITKLIESRIPFINSKQVNIVRIARIPGEITKVFVQSDQIQTPADLCFKTDEFKQLAREVREIIHILDWTDDPKTQVISALYPLHKGEVHSVDFNSSGKSVTVNVITAQTQREAVGKKGINVRVAEKLIDCRISIRVSD